MWWSPFDSHDASRQAAPIMHGSVVAPGQDGRTVAAFDAKVLRSFVVDDRLVSIPAQEKKKLVVLRYLLERCFAEDRPYPETEVNQRLALFHPDVAALRRYLVEYGLLTRDAGVYRRALGAAPG